MPFSGPVSFIGFLILTGECVISQAVMETNVGVSALSLFEDGPTNVVGSSHLSALDVFEDGFVQPAAEPGSAETAAEDRLQSMLQQFDSEFGDQPLSDDQGLRAKTKLSPEELKASKQRALDKNRKQRWVKKSVTEQTEQEKKPQEDPNEDHNLHALDKIASALWTSDVLRGARRHSGQFLDISTWSLKEYACRLVAMAFDHANKFSDILINKLIGICKHGSASSEAHVPDALEDQAALCPRLFLRVRQYDETPLKLKAGDLQAGNSQESQPQTQKGHQDTQTCKLLATEQRWAAIFSDSKNGHSVAVEAQVPTALQVISTNSAQLIAAAVRKSMDSAYNKTTATHFRRLVDVVCTDDYVANHLAEQMLRESNVETSNFSTCGTLHVVCDVHKIQACAGAMFSLLPEFTSGLVKAALSLQSGQMRMFRERFKEVIAERLKVYYGDAPLSGALPFFSTLKILGIRLCWVILEFGVWNTMSPYIHITQSKRIWALQCKPT